ncbi:heterokaryon incompatibility protein-domain-containing protein [Bisporella sp. PMI_857]|nr:heterokaryon incompatibility protein-domain-containing protein [Bisporella sp. PMI_857]
MAQTDDVARTDSTKLYSSNKDCLLASKRSFRLLTFSDFWSEDGIFECSLQSYELLDGQYPKYTALSYTWGDSRRCVPIIVNGVKFYITSNLLVALQHLKDIQKSHPDISGRWWVDMISINQDDDRERGHQVSIMRDIFQCASLVIAWLGPEAGGSRTVMQGLKGQVPPPSSPSLHQTREFLSRPYWSRLWIIQEICVARDVLFACGTETAPWASFRDQLQVENCRGQTTKSYSFHNPVGTLSVSDFRLLIPYNLVDLREKFQNRGMSLGSILTFTSQSASTDPRDRVFAILALASRGAGNNIVPDYTLSPCSVYCSAIRAVYEDADSIHKSKVRDLVMRCRHNPLSEDNSIRRECDGMECNAWWSCLDAALWDMSD